MALTHKNVTDILKIVDESDIEELVLDIDGAKLVIRRGAAAAASPTPPATPIAPAPVVAPPTAPPVKQPETRRPVEGKSPKARAERTDGKTEVRAPMVGTFYRRPSPQDPVFVEVGTAVKKGDPLCLIEVMKLYTTIEAPCNGKVVEIGADNAALVEHDAVLFVIEPSS